MVGVWSDNGLSPLPWPAGTWSCPGRTSLLSVSTWHARPRPRTTRRLTSPCGSLCPRCTCRQTFSQARYDPLLSTVKPVIYHYDLWYWKKNFIRGEGTQNKNRMYEGTIISYLWSSRKLPGSKVQDDNKNPPLRCPRSRQALLTHQKNCEHSMWFILHIPNSDTKCMESKWIVTFHKALIYFLS